MCDRRNKISPWWFITAFFLIAVVVTTSGCAGGWKEVSDAFELSLLEHEQKYGCGGCDWSEGDWAAYAKMEDHTGGAYPDYEFTTACLDYSHRTFDLIEQSGQETNEMRVVTIVLNDETLKHAVLLVDGTIYDNGYLTDMPFNYEDLSFYGNEIENVWSPERYR